ncbi:hypothetical protein [Williamsia soli]|uniref:hypothetical protein n=1 Tax=Williamsia soli TaxID=364929 RepID=UPI001A9E3D0A|nr:hypothetical protein [Williamsia soli]
MTSDLHRSTLSRWTERARRAVAADRLLTAAAVLFAIAIPSWVIVAIASASLVLGSAVAVATCSTLGSIGLVAIDLWSRRR